MKVERHRGKRALALKKVVTASIAVASVSGLVAGCTINPNRLPKVTAEHQQQDQGPKISVEDGSKDVNPAKPVTVEAGSAPLADVTMTNDAGKEVKAKLSEDGTSWTTDEDLGYYRQYTLKAKDKNDKTVTAEFTTTKPSGTTSVAISPTSGSEVGVGQTIMFNFGQSVYDRKAAENAIKVETEPRVEGAFYWLNNSMVRWRPKEFWKPGTKVKVHADLYGTNLGNETFGQDDNSTDFTIGDQVISEVDSNTKKMVVKRNGEKIKEMPVSLGNAANPTPNGTYFVGDRNPSMIMNSETFGLPIDKGGYKTKVNWATQLSWSGIYAHSAPWSVWAQGNTDTSHGCINLSPENAKWYLELSKPGDVVKVKNTNGGELSGVDGLGDWNISWDKWSKGNADEGPGSSN